MKITNNKIKKLIQEAILKEFGIVPIDVFGGAQHLERRGLNIETGFEHMINKKLGDIQLAKMYMKYLEPFKDDLRVTIEYNGSRIEVLLRYDGKLIGETSAYRNEYDTSIFTVSYGGNMAGRKRGTRGASVDTSGIDAIFLQKGYGPITYELAIEYLSIKGYALTSDRTTLSEDAYNIWHNYYYNRSDVQKRLIDYNEEGTGLGQYNPLTISAEKHYLRLTGKASDKLLLKYMDTDPNPLATDEDLRRMFIDYLNNESPIMQAYSKKDRPFLAAVRNLGILTIRDTKNKF